MSGTAREAAGLGGWWNQGLVGRFGEHRTLICTGKAADTGMEGCCTRSAVDETGSSHIISPTKSLSP